MKTVDEIAEELFRAEVGPPMFPYSPYGRHPQLRDLWPVDQERYRRMAEAMIRNGTR